MFDSLIDIKGLYWRENERNNDGECPIVKDLRIGDYFICEADKRFFETDKPEKYGGWVTGINTRVLKFSATHPNNKFHGYDGATDFDGKLLREILLTADNITKYAILFRD